MASGESAKKSGRKYRPAVEGLENIRLFHASVAYLSGLAADHAFLEPSPQSALDVPPVSSSETHAWDAVLESRVADLLAPKSARLTVSDPASFQSGLQQLDRYLGRTWARAGISPQKGDDCTQSVYVSLIESLGRTGFDRLLSDIGGHGIREVLSRETLEGPVFFRAIDAVKKRAQREHSYNSLDDAPFDPEAAAGPSDSARHLDEAIHLTLNPREAELIRSTLAGESPAEIAERWGVAAKTVSNEKTRAFSKLRDFLTNDSLSYA